MTQTLLPPPTAKKQLDEQLRDEDAHLIILEDVSWELYELLLKDLDHTHRHVRVSYDEGTMEIMTLTNRHEQNKTLIGRLVEIYALEMDIDVIGVGSVTLKIKSRRKGLEPDECYYVSTPAPDVNVMRLNLKKYPPPDLAIEIDITRDSMDRQPIYATIGVPEVWRFDGEKVTVLRRGRDGKYKRAARSLAFPKLSMTEFNRFVALATETTQHAAVKAFRNWLREKK